MHEQELSDRVNKIKQSICRINKLMSDLRSLPSEKPLLDECENNIIDFREYIKRKRGE
jgi:hypothetical protein